MRHVCGLSLSAFALLFVAWLASLPGFSRAAPAPPDLTGAWCVVVRGDVLVAAVCPADRPASPDDRVTRALGGRPCWWNLGLQSADDLPGVSPRVAAALLELRDSDAWPTVERIDALPRVGPRTAENILRAVDLNCAAR
jgi:hypothetical protein